MARKTLKLADMVEQANTMLRDSKPEMRQGREALGVFITEMLMKAGAYKGFSYLRADDMTDKSWPPGIIFDAVGHKHQYPDATRVHFNYQP